VHRSLIGSRVRVSAILATAVAGLLGVLPSGAPAVAGTPTMPSSTLSGPSAAFTYGADLGQEAPDLQSGNDPDAVASAQHVMSSIPMLVDQALMSWGVPSPEPSPGVYVLGPLQARIQMIESTGDTPLIDLASAPDWMKAPGDIGKLAVPPLPSHYQDFANLAATVAAAFPDVKYFAVWKEMHGFWNPATRSYDMQSYDTFYNDVYTAIKAVRPDALVGGPYISIGSYSHPKGVAPSGPWGYVNPSDLLALQQWLTDAVGADFVALDARNFTNDAGYVADPVTSAGKYAALDQWVKTQTALPIWWIESPTEVTPLGWSTDEQVAARVGVVAEMAASGAAVGMQWQPQQSASWPDLGLWTSCLVEGGGQPTALGQIMPSVTSVLKQPVTQVAGQPTGVLLVSGTVGTIAVNGTSSFTVASMGSLQLVLAPYQVRVLLN